MVLAMLGAEEFDAEYRPEHREDRNSQRRKYYAKCHVSGRQPRKRFR